MSEQTEKKKEYQRKYAKAHKEDRNARQKIRYQNVKAMKTSAPTVEIECLSCKKKFRVTEAMIRTRIKSGYGMPKYCSKHCYYLSKIKPGGFSKLPYMDEVNELLRDD